MLEETLARELLLDGEYGFLAMVNTDGGGYGVPLSYAWDGGNRIWFHGAPEGHKLENVLADDRVTFTVVGGTQVLPDKFSTLYRSVMVFGRVRVVEEEPEKREALERIAGKYSPDAGKLAVNYIRGSFARTSVLCLEIAHLTAKGRG